MLGAPCASLDYIPKTKSRPKNRSPRKHCGPQYKFSRVNLDTDKYYIGDVWLGKTNNILPTEWLSGDAELKSSGDNDKLILKFNSTIVVVTITTDVQFLKDLLYIRLFKLDFKLNDENVIASLYLNEIPLPKFSNKIGSVLKTVFSLVFSVCCEYNEINSIKSSCTVEHFDTLYKNVACLRKSIPQEQIYHEQLKPTLRPYQWHAVRWMLHRESLERDREVPHLLYKKITLPCGVDVYFDKYIGRIELTPPVVTSFQSGGILADEMGLGKTVEILALALLHKRNIDINIEIKSIPNNTDNVEEQLDSSPIDNSQELEENSNVVNDHQDLPIVQVLSKKRKRQTGESDLYDTHIIKEKKIKKQPGNSKKSMLRLALQSWYDTMLGYNKVDNNEPLVQCICGEIDESDAVGCVYCEKMQHATCLGYKEKYGPYICPQCWMDQPVLESKATLIVTPTSLKQQWCDEICKHVTGKFKVLQYETGQNIKCIYPRKLQGYDVVITTYSTLQSELRLSDNGQPMSLRRPSKYSLPGSPITLVNWWRLCLDEAQTVETPGNMVSIMANKLNAQYRWAVTGTPISKDISDLYGLINYLQITPYSELETWQNILYKPYINGRKLNMHNFLSEVMWRTSKKDVLDQINIPPQTMKEYWIEFTAVEKFFYEKEHELSCQEFLTKLRNVDLTLPLKLVNKSVLRKIMIPLLALRQACVHHQTVRGRYLATRAQVNSMEDLLDALLAKSLTQCEESLRTIVSAMNGMASIFILEDNHKLAAAMYRKVLDLSKQYSEQEKDIALEADRLQLIHVVYNLTEILELHENVPKTIDDDSLGAKCRKLEEDYLDRFMKPVVTTINDNVNLSGQISELQKKFVLPPGQWFADTLDWMTIENFFSQYFKKLQTLSSNAEVILGFNCNSERAVMFKISTWDEQLTEVKVITVSSIEDLIVFNKDQSTYSVPMDLIKQASDCHLRPDKKSKNKKNKEPHKKCPVCIANMHLKKYESILFSSKQKDDDVSNSGSWKPAVEELMLRALYSVGKSFKADKDLLHDGAIHLEILELLRKEFKEIRKLWTLIDTLICAKDELDMCKMRLQLKEANSEESTPVRNRTLKALDYEIRNRSDDIYCLEASEIPYQLAHLSSQERCGLKMLEENIGTYKYLQTLHKQQMKGEDPDPCPICKTILNKQWNIITCGHCYCIECMQVLIGQQTNLIKKQYITCAICRKVVRISDISYIHKDEKKTNPDGLQIMGNCSSKVEAVIKLILELKGEDKDVKVLVFSNWVALLKLMQTIFTLNNISSEVLLQQQFERSLDNFKDAKKGVTALLLPLKFGGKGLNLIEATHIIFVEPLLNPGDELQAIGRVHRIGQTKPTVVHKFFIKSTIEESIYHTMSTNTEEWDNNRVTLGHFKQLFDYTSFNSSIDNVENPNDENSDISIAIDADDTTSNSLGVDTNISVTSIETTTVSNVHDVKLLKSSTASTSTEQVVRLALNSEIAEVDTNELIDESNRLKLPSYLTENTSTSFTNMTDMCTDDLSVDCTSIENDSLTCAINIPSDTVIQNYSFESNCGSNTSDSPIPVRNNDTCVVNNISSLYSSNILFNLSDTHHIETNTLYSNANTTSSLPSEVELSTTYPEDVSDSEVSTANIQSICSEISGSEYFCYDNNIDDGILMRTSFGSSLDTFDVNTDNNVCMELFKVTCLSTIMEENSNSSDDL